MASELDVWRLKADVRRFDTKSSWVVRSHCRPRGGLDEAIGRPERSLCDGGGDAGLEVSLSRSASLWSSSSWERDGGRDGGAA